MKTALRDCVVTTLDANKHKKKEKKKNVYCKATVWRKNFQLDTYLCVNKNKPGGARYVCVCKERYGVHPEKQGIDGS